jgi:ferritin-like metal-binding protein YciE
MTPKLNSPKANPSSPKPAGDEELRVALEAHVELTKGQIERLVQIGNLLGVTLEGETCEAAKALVKEGQEIAKEDGDPSVKDAALLAAAQGVEHYEIAGYGTASAYARRLGYRDIDKLLQQTLRKSEVRTHS